MSERVVKVFVAEDNELQRTFFERALNVRGYEVSSFENGLEFLKAYESGNVPDILLLDFMMPLYDGFEVLKKIRETKEPTELPVIMVTGAGQRETVIKAVKAGVNDFITKPVKISNLEERIQRHVFRLDTLTLRGLLPTLNMPDQNALGPALNSYLTKQNIAAYPVEHEGVKLCVLVEFGKNPTTMMGLDEEKLMENLTVMARPGYVWNKIWPNKKPATPEQFQAEEETLLNFNENEEWSDLAS